MVWQQQQQQQLSIHSPGLATQGKIDQELVSIVENIYTSWSQRLFRVSYFRIRPSSDLSLLRLASKLFPRPRSKLEKMPYSIKEEKSREGFIDPHGPRAQASTKMKCTHSFPMEGVPKSGFKVRPRSSLKLFIFANCQASPNSYSLSQYKKLRTKNSALDEVSLAEATCVWFTNFNNIIDHPSYWAKSKWDKCWRNQSVWFVFSLCLPHFCKQWFSVSPSFNTPYH